MTDLSPIQTLKQILTFYNCPPECEAVCCKTLDIPIDAVSRKRIMSLNKQSKKIMNSLTVSSDGSIKFNGKTLKKDRMLPVKPCPFMSGKRCDIYTDRPGSCQLFPFDIKFSDDPTNTFIYEVANCLMGFNISLDYLIFIAYFGVHTETNTKEIYRKHEDFLRNQLSLDMSEKENFTYLRFSNIEVLRAFVLFLQDVSEEKKEEYRKRILEDIKTSVLAYF